jgi:hypothetical protein
MAYCWAALRTLGILVGVFLSLLVLAAIASGVVNAFLYTFEAGCLALALVFSVLALFGHQLVRVSKTPRTRRIGNFARNCGGAVAILALASFAVNYGYSAVKDSRVAAAHGPWEQYATKKPVTDPALLAQLNGPMPPQLVADKPPFDPSKPFSAAPDPYRTAAANSIPTCDEALIAAYILRRARTASLPPPPSVCVPKT